jgi:hypothetical protein
MTRRDAWCATFCAAVWSLSAGCTPGAPDASDATVHDSAGVRIIEFDSATESRVQQWRLAAAPDLAIANREDDPRYQFFRVMDAVALNDGIAVAVDGTNDIRVHDENGRFVRAIGRAGDGPGEFGGLAWLQVRGDDTIVAYDRRHRRLSLFDGEGRLVREVSITRSPASLAVSPMQGAQPKAVLADGGILVALYESPSRMDGLFRPRVTLHRYGHDGTPGDALVTTLGDDIFFVSEGDRVILARPPFARVSVFLSAGNGFWVADNDRWELRRYGGDGALRQIVRRSQAGGAVTPALLETYIEAQLADYPQTPALERSRALMHRMAVHTSLPAYVTAHVADDSHVWVRAFVVPQGEYTYWSVVSPEGKLVRRMTIPSSLRVLRFGADFVIGVVTDDLDREAVHRYRFVEDTTG